MDVEGLNSGMSQDQMNKAELEKKAEHVSGELSLETLQKNKGQNESEVKF